jgi:hypothetical protein
MRKRNKHHTSMFGPRTRALKESTGIDQRDDNIRNGIEMTKDIASFGRHLVRIVSQ